MVYYSQVNTAIRLIYFTLLVSAFSFRAPAEDFTNAIRAFLQRRVEVDQRDVGLVVGLVDEHGRSIVSCGKTDDGGGREVNGDTVFEIGSITKTFTGLLLQGMVDRGEMNLDDPVAKYLPPSVKVPDHDGKPITLLQLATHTSGLPTASINWIPKRAEDPRADCTTQRLYDVVSSCKLSRDPGTKYEYSTVGMALLGQAIALKAGTNYESLVVDRICRPLAMDSTRITLTPELKSRLAQGHNYFGYPVPASYWGAWAPGAALRSTANDLLKYVSANLGLTPSPLTPLMEKTHLARFYARMDTDTFLDTHLGLAWMLTRDRQGTQIIEQGGLTDGFIAFICLDPTRRRGVVILSNSQDYDVGAIGTLLLESEWRSDRRSTETGINGQIDDAYVGKYQQSGVPDPASNPVIGIRWDGNRLFIQATRPKASPADVLLPPVPVELLPESENRFFERLSNLPITFSRDARGQVAGLTLHYPDKVVAYDRISAAPPESSVPPKPRIAIKLDAKLLDACVGQYELSGGKLKIWREGDQLVGQGPDEFFPKGAFNIYAESETVFFLKLDGSQLIFRKNGKEDMTAVVHRSFRAGVPDAEGKKLKNGAE